MSFPTLKYQRGGAAHLPGDAAQLPARTMNWDGLPEVHSRTGFMSEKLGFGNVIRTSAQPFWFSFSVHVEIRTFEISVRVLKATVAVVAKKRKKGKKEEENTRTRGQVGQAWGN